MSIVPMVDAWTLWAKTSKSKNNVYPLIFGGPVSNSYDHYIIYG